MMWDKVFSFENSPTGEVCLKIYRAFGSLLSNLFKLDFIEKGVSSEKPVSCILDLPLRAGLLGMFQFLLKIINKLHFSYPTY